MDTFSLSESLSHKSALVLFYSPVLSDFLFEDGFGAKHRLPFGTGNYLPHLARELPVSFACARALPICHSRDACGLRSVVGSGGK